MPYKNKEEYKAYQKKILFKKQKKNKTILFNK